MKSFLSFVNSKLPYNAVAIGKFDGMHKAHLKLLGLLGNNGAAISIASTKPPFVVPPSAREAYSNVAFYRIRFDIIKDFSAEEFLNLLFFIMPNLKKIVVGYDFCFGRNRTNSVSDIRGLLNHMDKTHVEIEILESQKHNDTPIHTSIIKELIKYGDMPSVNGMLGRLYAISGMIIKGQGIGATKLYPTINIKSSLYVIPKFGVYATFSIYKGSCYKSVSFIGHRVSTDAKFCIETHIIGLDCIDVMHGTRIELRFVKMIRNNQKFDSLDELKSQISLDIQIAKDILKSY